MPNRDKVVWYEGMHLDPHHFQQWERQQGSALDFRIRSVRPFDWGLLDLAVDQEALLNGQFRLLKCRGIMPDGLVFNIPDDDPAPPARNFKDLFAPSQSEFGVFLAVPVEQPKGGNCRLEGDPHLRATRYTYQEIRVTDDNTGADERPIGVGRKNIQVKFASDALEDLSLLKIAEVQRAPDGSLRLHPSFIPPCLSLSASEGLMAIVRRLSELLLAKSSAFGAKSSRPGDSDWTARDFVTFLALQTLNTHGPLIHHLFAVGKAHPESAYMALLALGGQLTAFAPQAGVHPRDFPVYDHENPARCFPAMDLTIRGLLEQLLPQVKYVVIPIEKKTESLSFGHVGDSSLFQRAKFFMIAEGDFPEKKITDEMPSNVRIASPDTISSVLSSFLKALPLKFLPSPPLGLPKRERSYVFQLESGGPFWEAICRSQTIAVYVPNEFRGLRFELVAM